MKNRSAIMKTVPTENKLFLGEGERVKRRPDGYGGNNNRRVAKGVHPSLSLYQFYHNRGRNNFVTWPLLVIILSFILSLPSPRVLPFLAPRPLTPRIIPPSRSPNYFAWQRAWGRGRLPPFQPMGMLISARSSVITSPLSFFFFFFF